MDGLGSQREVVQIGSEWLGQVCKYGPTLAHLVFAA